MKLRIAYFPILLFTLLIAPLSGWAQFDFMQQGMSGGATFSHEFRPAEASVGQVISVVMEAEIDPGYHLYAASQIPAAEANAAVFSLDPEASGVELVGGLEDGLKPDVKFDDIFGYDLGEFHDRAIFVQKVKITSENPRLVGFLRYQVCNASQCIPQTYDIDQGLTVVAMPEPAATTTPEEPAPEEARVQEEVTPEDTPEPAQEDEAGEEGEEETEVGEVLDEVEAIAGEETLLNTDAGEPEEVKGEFEGLSLWGLILKGFLLGLVSIFTPCIFPMIPLTVSIFTKQGAERGKGLRKALFYGLSIVSIFTGLAILISAIFGVTALQQASNHPVFNLVFFAMLFIFALSFLGMFEITLPSSWSTAMSKRGDQGGLVGIFFMALALAIVSFSCTGPLVSYALGDALSSGFFASILIMLSFSTALALPFVILAAFPALLQSVPRAGGWLNAVKVSLGLVELALAFIYLSRADLVMHWGLLDREIFIGAWVVISAMLGLYLLGKIRLPHDDPPVEKLSVPRFMLAMGAFWFTLYLVPGMWGAPLKMLGGFIPSSTQDMGVLIQRDQLASLGTTTSAAANNDICTYPNKISGHLSEETPTGFCAFYDLEQGMAYAREVGKPVFLDFTGHTCANCRFLEKNAWVDPQLREYISEKYVLISLYTDDRESLPEIEYGESGKKLRTVGDKWLNYQVEAYGSNAQPYYVLLDHDGDLLLPPMGFNPPLDIQAYLDYFQRGLDVFETR